MDKRKVTKGYNRRAEQAEGPSKTASLRSYRGTAEER